MSMVFTWFFFKIWSMTCNLCLKFNQLSDVSWQLYMMSHPKWGIWSCLHMKFLSTWKSFARWCFLVGTLSPKNSRYCFTDGIYIWSPPQGRFKLLGVGSSYWIITTNQYDHMFKNISNTGKKCILHANVVLYIDISKGKHSNFLQPESGSEKGPIHLQIVKPWHEKRTWPFKKLHGKQKAAHVSRTFVNNRNNITIEMNNCIGF